MKFKCTGLGGFPCQILYPYVPLFLSIELTFNDKYSLYQDKIFVIKLKFVYVVILIP